VKKTLLHKSPKTAYPWTSKTNSNSSSVADILLSKPKLVISTQPPYRISFRTNALAANELQTLAQLVAEHGSIDKAIQEATENNTLLHNTTGSAKRELNQLRLRLTDLPEKILSALPDLPPVALRQIALLSLCLTYPVVLHFIEKLLIDKIASFDTTLTQEDVNTFFLREEDEHPELEAITESTYKKLKQVLIRALVDARILESTKIWNIQRQVIEPETDALISAHFPHLRHIFLPI